MKFSLIDILSTKIWSTDREKRHRRDVRNARTMMRFNMVFTLPCLTLAFVFMGTMGLLQGEYAQAAMAWGAIPLMWWLLFKLDRFTKQRESALNMYGSHIVSQNALREITENEDED